MPIQPHGLKPSLFCVHVLGRSLKFYIPLAHHFALEQPFYGLVAQMLDKKYAPPNRVEPTFRRYDRKIRYFKRMGNFRASDIRVQDIDHCGIIAGICDEMELVEQIDRQLGTHPQEIISPGQVVKAMLLNGLGFMSAPLYLFEKFFVGKATEYLLGEGIRSEHLNDDRLGRILDKLSLFCHFGEKIRLCSKGICH